MEEQGKWVGRNFWFRRIWQRHRPNGSCRTSSNCSSYFENVQSRRIFLIICRLKREIASVLAKDTNGGPVRDSTQVSSWAWNHWARVCDWTEVRARRKWRRDKFEFWMFSCKLVGLGVDLRCGSNWDRSQTRIQNLKPGKFRSRRYLRIFSEIGRDSDRPLASKSEVFWIDSESSGICSINDDVFSGLGYCTDWRSFKRRLVWDGPAQGMSDRFCGNFPVGVCKYRIGRRSWVWEKRVAIRFKVKIRWINLHKVWVDARVVNS